MTSCARCRRELTPELDIDNSFAVRLCQRHGHGCAARRDHWLRRIHVQPAGVIYRDSSGQEFRDRWKADAIIFSAGVVYSLF